MKNLLLALVFLFTLTSFAQNKNKRTSIEVDGVCLMCKKRIEKASLNTKGVKYATWNVETHELKLIFDERKTKLEAIQKSITAVGHDTKELKATEEAYGTVHTCCKYRDEEVKNNHKN